MHTITITNSSILPQLSSKFLLPFHCHFPTTPTKTNLISLFLPTLKLTNSSQSQTLKKPHFSNPEMSSSSNSNSNSNNGVEFDQNVLVMRHGDRMDNFVSSWVTSAERPWDPPLFDAGKTRAFNVGNEIRTQLNFPIHRVFVSPFLRCVQTASEVVSALCASDDTGSQIDPSKVKVSIEYGLCEMLSREAIRIAYAPKDGNFSFNLSELEALLPAGTVDHTAERIYPQMPRWEETVSGSRKRYERVIQALSDKYPRENLLLVTHGEGVGTSVSTFKSRAVVYEVNYCAYSHAKRCITIGEGGSVTAGNFQLLTVPNKTGIGFHVTESCSLN